MTMARREDRLLFLPLGGVGEIGMNCCLYGSGGKWLMVDLGMAFADERLPGIDLVVPDLTYIEERRDDLTALVLTHGHEDHLGAVPYLWERLRCPIYATAFTATLLRSKLREAGLLDRVPLIEFRAGETLDLGPFRVRALTVTHSIPEAHSLLIETGQGRVLHTGDWKLDPDPLVGPETDAAGLAAAGDAGILALVCDSTNVLRPGTSGSEAAVRAGLRTLLAARRGRIVLTTFASNVARIDTILALAAEIDRHVVLVGRSLWRVVEAAKACGYLADRQPVLSERDYGYLPRDKVLLLCTGCQGEPKGAMARIAAGQHPHVALSTGDLAVFSSKIIPGNERTLYRLHDRLARSGIEVVSEKDHFVHVSGHPSRDELARYYAWARPEIAVPVHGEPRHLIEHARLARSLGVPQVASAENGALWQLAPGPARQIETVPSGRLAVETSRVLLPIEGGVLQERRRLMHHGSASVALVLTADGSLALPPTVGLHGIAETAGPLEAKAAAAIAAALTKLSRNARSSDDAVEEAVRQALRRTLKPISERRPLVRVHLLRLAADPGPSPEPVTADILPQDATAPDR